MHSIKPGSIYQWEIGGGENIEENENTLLARWINNPGTLFIRETDAFGCKGNSDTLSITVSPRPTGILSGPDFLCPSSFTKTFQLFGDGLVQSALFEGGSLINLNSDQKGFVGDFDSLAPVHRVFLIPKSVQGCLGDTITKTLAIDRVNPQVLSASVAEPGTVKVNLVSSEAVYLPKIKVFNGNDLSVLEEVEDAQEVVFSGLITTQPLRIQLSVVDKCAVERNSGFHQLMFGAAVGNVTSDQMDITCQWTPYLGASDSCLYQLYREMPSGDWQKVSEGNTLTSLIRDFPVLEKPNFRVRAQWNSTQGELESWSDRFDLPQIVKPKLQFPNLITNNGDGVNDVWEIPYLYWYQNPTLKIYNRWGKEVFHSNLYENNWKPGKDESGLFFYSVSAEGLHWNGWISVVR